MFALPAIEGPPRALADERGAPVLLHFFATWCEPCKPELRSLAAFNKQRGGQVRILAVSVGDVPSRVRRFLEETPVNFPIVLDAGRSVARAWNIEGLPSTIVLDGNLTPRLAVTGDLDWMSPAVGQEIDRALAHEHDPTTNGKCSMGE